MGWYLRSDIVWNKPNAMPESASDRPTKSHDYVFLLSKSERYFFDSEAIKERSSGNAHARGSGHSLKGDLVGFGIRANPRFYKNTGRDTVNYRNKRTVWSIPTQQYTGSHNATFRKL